MINQFPKHIEYKGKKHNIPRSAQMRLGVEIESEFTSLEIINAASIAQSDPNKFPSYKAAIAFHAALRFLGVEADAMEVRRDLMTEEGEKIVEFLTSFALASMPELDSEKGDSGGNSDVEKKPSTKSKSSTKRRT